MSDEQSDRTLIQLAATAAGYGPRMQTFGNGLLVQSGTGPEQTGITFNPLNDDGDALRLAVKLRLLIVPQIDGRDVIVDRYGPGEGIQELCGTDPAAATCRAIVRAAAEIGRTQETAHG